jgi:hypothetical protein
MQHKTYKEQADELLNLHKFERSDIRNINNKQEYILLKNNKYVIVNKEIYTYFNKLKEAKNAK